MDIAKIKQGEYIFRVWDRTSREMSIPFHFPRATHVKFKDGRTTLLKNLWKTRYDLMQFTSVFDKNKRRIFDHDIIKVKFEKAGEQIRCVELAPYLGGYTPFVIHTKGDTYVFGNYWVIGNAFENAELWEKHRMSEDKRYMLWTGKKRGKKT